MTPLGQPRPSECRSNHLPEHLSSFCLFFPTLARSVSRKSGCSKDSNHRAYKVIDVHERHGKPQEAEVQVIALGRDVAWVALPGEIFVELGLAIKKASPFPQTIVAELANGSLGYIPTRQAYAQGNYEVVSARVAAGSGEKLVEAATRILRALFADASREDPAGADETVPR